MKLRIIALAAAAGLLLVCLLMQAPARLLASVVPSGQLALEGLSGTLWQGQAARAVLTTPNGPLHLGAVNWRLRPLSLLTFAPTLDFESRWADQRASGALTLRGQQNIDLAGFEGEVAADLLQQVLPVSLRGRFSAQLQALSLRGGMPVSGEGRVVWQNASWLAPGGALVLGSYALDFVQPEGEALRGEIVTISGPVQAAGNVSLQDRAYRIDVRVSGDGGLDPQVSQALSLMGSPQDDGSIRVQLDGAL